MFGSAHRAEWESLCPLKATHAPHGSKEDCGTSKKIHIFWTNHLLFLAQTLRHRSVPNEITDETQVWKPRQPRTDGVQMAEITLTDQYQTRQPGRTCGLKYSSVRQRSCFYFRSDEVVHMPGIKHRCQTLGIVQLPDKGMKLVGLIWSTVFFIFSKHSSVQVVRLPWQHGTFVPKCHFPSQLVVIFLQNFAQLQNFGCWGNISL